MCLKCPKTHHVLVLLCQWLTCISCVATTRVQSGWPVKFSVPVRVQSGKNEAANSVEVACLVFCILGKWTVTLEFKMITHTIVWDNFKILLILCHYETPGIAFSEFSIFWVIMWGKVI